MGSPPRVRGTVAAADIFFVQRRITPACAGNSSSRPHGRSPCSDHPRVCGEQHAFNLLSVSQQGSPPRVRGTALCPWSPCQARGITPACAGNSIGKLKDGSIATDHPRVCGEQTGAIHSTSHHPGSPPRVRGTAAVTPALYLVTGITPACAGNRESPDGGLCHGGDHPRVCGEQERVNRFSVRCHGSPPRVRGTAFQGGDNDGLTRITPACAGNSSVRCPTGQPPPDHPRVCGEQQKSLTGPIQSTGSPPRVRGTAAHDQEGVRARRITPACAGNRGGTGTGRTEQRDHPRVCGEQLKGQALEPVQFGSPPRVRGTGALWHDAHPA